jgi:hypothetical protein
VTVKLHLFKCPPVKRYGLIPGEEVGHLVSDMPGEAGLAELKAAARSLGLREEWYKVSSGGTPHVDVWRGPLSRAKAKYSIISDKEVAEIARMWRVAKKAVLAKT